MCGKRVTFDRTLEIIRIILELRSQIPKSGPDADVCIMYYVYYVDKAKQLATALNLKTFIGSFPLMVDFALMNKNVKLSTLLPNLETLIPLSQKHPPIIHIRIMRIIQ